MTIVGSPFLRPRAVRCVVCTGPLAGVQRREPGARFCDLPACSFVRSREGSMPPAQFEFWVSLQARHVQARDANSRAHASAVAEKQRLEAIENEARWQALGATGVMGTVRMALPSGPRRLRNLPQARRDRYRDHLTRIITQAVTGAAVPEPHPPAAEAPALSARAQALSGQLCAACSGGCCTEGDTTAYLSAATIRRFMRANPTMRPREVLAAYLDRLQPRTERGSCVNHTTGGCSLTREMRADICNRYLCKPQKNLWASPRADTAESVVVIVRRQDQWHRDATDRPNDIIGSAVVSDSGVDWLTTEGLPAAPRIGT